MELELGFKNDPIFLLSVDEFNACFGQDERLAQCWLRDEGHHDHFAAFVGRSGSVDRHGDFKHGGYYDLKPVVKLNNVKADKNQVIKYANRDWFVFRDGYAIAVDPIAHMCFDNAYASYEDSDVRKFLLAWYMKNVVMKTTEIVISVSGGLVQDVFVTSGHPVTVRVIDDDTECWDELDEAHEALADVMKRVKKGEMNCVY